MKRIVLSLALALAAVFSLSPAVRGNMAAPAYADVGSSITFPQNQAVAVLSEILDITVHGAKAEISATYHLKNTTGNPVSTPAMFLSPNIEDSGTAVVVNSREAPFTVESYGLNYSTTIETDQWQYIVLTEDPEITGEQTVDAITFTMDFAPEEEYDVMVSYTYRLGGYPDLDFNAKRGEIVYYLTPAAMWKDFGQLTINVYLDEDMPVITSSNLDFEKVGKRTYQHVSDTLPEEDLRITIDENWMQNISSTLRSPYLGMYLSMASCFCIPVILLITVLLLVRRYRKNRGR